MSLSDIHEELLLVFTSHLIKNTTYIGPPNDGQALLAVDVTYTVQSCSQLLLLWWAR
jgi:hypothetical protein